MNSTSSVQPQLRSTCNLFTGTEATILLFISMCDPDILQLEVNLIVHALNESTRSTLLYRCQMYSFFKELKFTFTELSPTLFTIWLWFKIGHQGHNGIYFMNIMHTCNWKRLDFFLMQYSRDLNGNYKWCGGQFISQTLTEL